MLIDPSDAAETEARARHEWERAQSCLRIARNEADAERPQRWLVNDFKRAAKRHIENWLAYRKLAAMQRRRAMRLHAVE